ncbi:MAG: hypothetical protein AAFV80_23275 [Bacteroidota bacterium]
MNTIHKIGLLAIFMGFLLTACQKENIDEIIPEEPIIVTDTIEVNPLVKQLSASANDALVIDCISIPLPIDFLTASGDVITVYSEADLDSTIVDFVYPFDVENTNSDTVLQIATVEELVLAITDCSTTLPECTDADAHVLLFFNALDILTINIYEYDVNYPVDLIVEGVQVTINSDDEYLPAVGGSPFDLLETELVYPITITQFGEDITLNNDGEVCQFYETLDEPCENKPAHIQFFFNEGGGVPVNCAYFINYPVEITSNGSTLTIAAPSDYLNELNASPTAFDDFELVYPASITNFNSGDQIVFNTDADICLYLDNCE